MESEVTGAAQPKEPKEFIRHGNAEWLGGVFEIGGTLGFVTLSKKGKKYAYPWIQYHDNDELRLRHILTILAPQAKYRSELKSWRFELRGSHVPDIVARFASFAPSRKDIMDAFITWKESSIEERAEVANRFQTRDRTYVEPQEYEKLIENPHFLAGVVDSRGIWLMTRDPRPRPQLLVVGQNKVMLDTLKAKYGGSVFSSHRKGVPEEEVNSHTWRLTSERQIDELISKINSSSHFPDKIKHVDVRPIDPYRTS